VKGILVKVLPAHSSGNAQFRRGLFRGWVLFLRAPAFSADPDDTQEVLGNFKLMFCGHRILNCFEFSREEFDYLAALRTNHVIVVLVFVVMFVVRAPIPKANLTREPRLSKELQRSVDGSLTHRGIFLFDQPIEIFMGEMLFGAKKYMEDQVSLRGTFQPFFLDVFEEHFLFFCYWFGPCHGQSDFNISALPAKDFATENYA